VRHPRPRRARRSWITPLVAIVALLVVAVPADAAHRHGSRHHAHASRVIVRARIVRLLAARRVRMPIAHRARRKPPGPAPVAPPAAVPTTAVPTPSASPSGPPQASPQTAWRAPGSAPLSDAAAAALVQPARETRPDNAQANAYRPTPAELGAFRNGDKDGYGRTMVAFNPLDQYVTGGFTGTTDEILQWAARKWGIPEDVVRAVAVTESNWHMSQLGDRTTVGDPSAYPGFSRIAGTSDVFESLGLMQVRWRPNRLHWGTESLRWRSTAFNVDYWAAQVRYFYDGLCDWCGGGYSAGQAWASVGAWYNPSPWDGSTAYADHVKQTANARVWARPGF
jgi:hypothetical protein